MKKKLAFVLIGCFMLCVAGCGGKEKVMTCTRTMNQSGMKADLKYEVTYKNDIVKKVKSTEKITSSSDSLLKTYKETVEKAYEPYKNIEHYKYSVTLDRDTLTSTADINYEKIDTDKMIKIDSANAQLIKDGKVNLEDLKSAYSSLGVTCEE